jgi:MFS family permease
MMSGNSVALVTSAFPSSQRGKVVGIITAATYTGLSIGPVLGGFLTSEFGWRSIFYLNVPLGLITVMLCHFKTYERFEIRRGASVDVLGGLSLIASLSSILASVSLSQTAVIPRQYIFGLVSIGMLSLLFFAFVEKRFAKQPLVDVRLFTENRAFAFSNLTALLHYLASYGVGFLMSLYLQLILRLDPYQAGLVMLSQPFLMAVVSPFSGHLSDRIEPRLLSSLGLAVMTAAILVLSGVSNETTISTIVLTLFVLGFGYGLFSSPNTNAVMGSVPKESLGLASGVLATMRFLGQSLSLVLVTFVLTSSVSADILIVGREQLNVPLNEFLFGVRGALQICAVISAAATIVSMTRGKVPHIGLSHESSMC